MHQEGEDIAARAAAEAVEDALVRGHGKRGFGVRVEGADTDEVFAPLLEFDILADDFLQGSRVFDLQELVFRDESGHFIDNIL